jgi:hypothetical protein
MVLTQISVLLLSVQRENIRYTMNLGNTIHNFSIVFMYVIQVCFLYVICFFV